MTGIQTGGIWILRHELLGQLSDIFSAHQGKAPCPCWESTVLRLGKQRAHLKPQPVIMYKKQKMIHLHLNQCANVSSLQGLRLTVKSRHLKYSFDYLPKYTSCYKRIVQKTLLKRLS